MRKRTRTQKKVASMKSGERSYLNFGFGEINKTPKSFTYKLFGEEFTKPMSEYSKEYESYVIRINY